MVLIIFFAFAFTVFGSTGVLWARAKHEAKKKS